MTGRESDKQFVLTSEPSKMNGGGVASSLTVEHQDLTDSNRAEIKVTGITIPTYMSGVVQAYINGDKVGGWDTSPAGDIGSRTHTFDPPLTFPRGELVIEFAREPWHTVPDLPLIEVYGYIDNETVDNTETTPWGDD